MPKAAEAGRDDRAVVRFIEQFALIMAESGFPRMPARVFLGLLVADEVGRTAGELAELLQVSPAAISGAARYLMQIGMVRREREPGRRSDHYSVSSTMWYETLTRRDAIMVQWEHGLADGIAAVGPDSPAGRRLDETRRFFEFIRGEFPNLIVKWRALCAAEDECD